jgi:hypothetical protein
MREVRKVKKVFLGIGALISFIALMFILNLGGLEWMKFFSPKYQNVERKVFENTQSYVHGQIQNLSKHYGEYQKADNEGKAAIRGIVSVQFAQFDLNHVPSLELKRFLIQCRGY